MAISLEDWTFGNDLLLAFDSDDRPTDTAEMAPICRIRKDVSIHDKAWMFPTLDTIGGEPAEGWNEARLTFWTKLVSVGSSNPIRFAFRRMTDLTNDDNFASATISAYVFTLWNTGFNARRYVAGSADSVFMSGSWGSSTMAVWAQHKLEWSIEGGELKLAYFYRFNALDDWTEINSATEPNNSYVDDANKIAFYLPGSLKLEGIHVTPL